MTSQYEINGCLKMVEEDVFEHGCQPETGQSWHIDVKLSADSVAGLVEKVLEFCGGRPGAELLDACEEDGRIDVQVMETEDGLPASDADLDAWQEGKLRLWLADYSFRVELVERKTVPLFQDISTVTEYGLTQKLSNTVRVF